VSGPRERGGTAIPVAFMLLTLMAGAAFATSRNLARELAVGGTALQGALADAAAESGLAWFLARAAGERGVAGVPSGPAAPPGLLAGASDGALRQGFELRIRLLGALPRPGGEAPVEQLWQVTAVGRSALPDQPGCLQVRELLVAEALERPGDLRLLAWTAP